MTRNGVYDEVKKISADPTEVYLTHGDIDHAGGLEQFGECHVHPADIHMIGSGIRTIPVNEGDKVSVGSFCFEVIEIPGHTNGSIAFFDKEMRWNEWPSFLLDMAKVIKNRGFDAEPLRNLLEEVVDEEKIRQSDVNFYLVTYSLTDKKELDLEAAALPKGTIHDMLLASAYFPAFKREPLSGKFYADGSIKNVVPLNSLVERGYKDIIVIRIFGVGYEKKVKIPEGVNVTVVAPREKLGGILQFDGEQTKKDMTLGYFDGMRLLYGLAGEKYYIDRKWSEEKAYAMLRAMIQWENVNGKQLLNLREINEEILPKMAKRLHVKGGYYELCLRMLEEKAEAFGITPFVIRTEEELLWEIAQMKKNK